MSQQLLEGKLRHVTATAVSAGAGNNPVDLRPPAGKAWRVLFARGTQDDGAVTVQWLMTDPDTAGGTIISLTSGGAWTSLVLGAVLENNPGTLPEAPIITYNRYFTYNMVASAAAKSAHMFAIVMEYQGVEASL